VTIEIKNILIVTSKYSKLHNIYRVLIDTTEKKKVLELLLQEGNLRQSLNVLDDIDERNSKSLIDGDNYFIYLCEENKAEIENSNLLEFYSKLIINQEKFKDSDVFTFKRTLTSYDKEKEKPRFYMFEIETKTKQFIAFSLIDSKNVVRKRSFLEWSPTVNNNSSVVDISEGVPLPDSITGLYERDTNKFYVYKPFDFDKMLYLHEASKEKAKANMGQFQTGKLTIGKEGYTVKGFEKEIVREKIMTSVRSINRIAKYDGSDSQESIEVIEKVMEKLEIDDQLEFDHDGKKVITNEYNYKTFVGVIHDSIVQRLISGDINII